MLAARHTALALLLLAGCSTSPRWNVTPLNNSSFENLPSTVKPPEPKPPIPLQPPSRGLPSASIATSPALTPHETWIPLQRWSRNNGLVVPERLTSAPAPTYSLHSSNG